MKTQSTFHFLVIEDSPTDLSILEEEFEKLTAAYSTTVLKCGERASEHILDENSILPDAILLDLGLPKIDGLQVLDTIKNNARFKTIPVYIMTGIPDSYEVDCALKNGAKEILIKPPTAIKIKIIIEGISK